MWGGVGGSRSDCVVGGVKLPSHPASCPAIQHPAPSPGSCPQPWLVGPPLTHTSCHLSPAAYPSPPQPPTHTFSHHCLAHPLPSSPLTHTHTHHTHTYTHLHLHLHTHTHTHTHTFRHLRLAQQLAQWLLLRCYGPYSGSQLLYLGWLQDQALKQGGGHLGFLGGRGRGGWGR